MTELEPDRGGSSDVLELPKPVKDRGGDQDRFAHYVRRDRANQAAITGQAVVALCGKVWVPTKDAKNYPVCPKCKALRDEIGKQGKNWPFAGD